MTLPDDILLLRDRLIANLSLTEEHVLVSSGLAGVDVRIFSELDGRRRRRACAVCRLTLPTGTLWTIRAGEDDDDIFQ